MFSEKGRATKDSPQAAQDRVRGLGSTGRPDRVTFWGQYTGGPEGRAVVGTVPGVVSSVMRSLFQLVIPVLSFSMSSGTQKNIRERCLCESRGIGSSIHSAQF